MADAVRVKEMKGSEAHRGKPRPSTADKTWEELTKAEKDFIMKAIAIRLGFVKED